MFGEFADKLLVQLIYLGVSNYPVLENMTDQTEFKVLKLLKRILC